MRPKSITFEKVFKEIVSEFAARGRSMWGWRAIIVGLSLAQSNIAISQIAPTTQPAPVDAESAAHSIETTVTLQAPGGDFDSLKKKIACENGSFSSEISFSQLTPKRPWESALQIILRSEEDQHVAARFSLATRETARAYLYASFDSGRDSSFARFSDRVQPDQAVQIVMTWADSKTVVVTMGKERARVTLKAPINELELVASGGAATFANNLLECAKK